MSSERHRAPSSALERPLAIVRGSFVNSEGWAACEDKDGSRELINDDVVFEIDYFVMLLQKFRTQHGDGEGKEVRAETSRAVDASAILRNKKDLIESFFDFVSVNVARCRQRAKEWSWTGDSRRGVLA